MKAEIAVSGSGAADGWVFQVQVREDGSSSRHRVTLKKADYERLGKPAGLSPEALIERSFEFLLAREPKESILSSFDLPVISRYFPEYESELQ